MTILNICKKAASALLAALLAFPAAVFAGPEEPSRSVSDYSGRTAVIAVVDAGFDVTHPAFSCAPAEVRLTREAVAEACGRDCYVSEKIPAAYDYACGDADVSNTSFTGTAASSLAAGHAPDTAASAGDDGTVVRVPGFTGAAPDAQLLLFKAAKDNSIRLDADAAAAAIRDALQLGACAILVNFASLSPNDALLEALREAETAGVPVLAGTGEINAAASKAKLPVTCTDRGTLADYSAIESLTLVGIAADPFAGVSSFSLVSPGAEPQEIAYTDSCTEYFGASFAALMAGQELPLVPVPGMGREEDYASLDCTGAIAVVSRGEITFTEKAQAAAAAGAAAMIVVDAGNGVSRMALDGAPIPAVMVDQESGELLRGSAAVLTAVFREGKDGASAYSASGLNRALSRTPAFLCAGEGVRAAIPAAAGKDGALYAAVTGSYYAAAAAAGYIARAAEYCARASLPASEALSLCVSAARAARDGDGDTLPPRLVGAGIVSGEGEYAQTLISSAEGRAVSVLGSSCYSTISFSVRITNETDTAKRYSLCARVYGDGYTETDGKNLLNGESEPIAGARMYVGDSGVNICANGGSYTPAMVTIGAHRTISILLRLTIPETVQRRLLSVFWNGFYADGVLELSDGGETETHPFTAFFGDWASAPLADPSAYTGEEAVFAPATLHIRRFDGENESALSLGTADPYVLGGQTLWDASYNLVDPASLRYGWVELHLCALRDIDSIQISFYDSERRLVFSRETGGASKYLRGGEAVIPLWDFIAADNADYLFPDGEYSCEIRLSSFFPPDMDAVQFLGFTFTVDSVLPCVGQTEVRRDGERLLLDVTAADNEALLSISAYDAIYTFPRADASAESPAGKKKAAVTFDVTQYDGTSPLYIEVTDRAGGYTVVRISPDAFAALAAQVTP